MDDAIGLENSLHGGHVREIRLDEGLAVVKLGDLAAVAHDDLVEMANEMRPGHRAHTPGSPGHHDPHALVSSLRGNDIILKAHFYVRAGRGTTRLGSLAFITAARQNSAKSRCVRPPSLGRRTGAFASIGLWLGR